MAHVCILARDRRYAQMIALTAEECGHRTVLTAESRELPPAAFYVIDADAFPAVRPDSGRIIYYGHTVKKPPFYSEEDGRVLFWHRPFSLTHLAAVMNNLSVERGLFLLPDGKAARLDGRQIPLSLREYALLSLLDSRRGETVTTEELLSAAWGDKGDRNLLRVTLFHLRKKLEADGSPRLLAVRGIGYRLRKEDTP